MATLEFQEACSAAPLGTAGHRWAQLPRIRDDAPETPLYWRRSLGRGDAESGGQRSEGRNGPAERGGAICKMTGCPGYGSAGNRDCGVEADGLDRHHRRGASAALRLRAPRRVDPWRSQRRTLEGAQGLPCGAAAPQGSREPRRLRVRTRTGGRVGCAAGDPHQSPVASAACFRLRPQTCFWEEKQSRSSGTHHCTQDTQRTSRTGRGAGWGEAGEL